MLKLADGADSKSVAEMRVGSSPTTPTIYKAKEGISDETLYIQRRFS